MLRTAAILLALSSVLAADVVVLKDGEKVGGRVTDKGSHYEVATEQGLRTYLKAEVDRVIASPQEFLGDAQSLFDQARQDYQKAVALSSPAQQNAVLKEAIGKLTKARQAYAGARELFTEDKYASLDQKLVQIMQLMRLLRERVGSEIASGPAVLPNPTERPAPPPPPAPARLEGVIATLLDPARRADAAARADAREALQELRGSVPAGYDAATAAALFLARPEADWKLAGPALAALQEYFAKGWLKDLEKQTPAAHAQAAAFLLDRIAAVSKQDPKASTEALALFAAGHLGHMAAGADRDRAAKTLGFVSAEGRVGTVEGLAVRDMNSFIRQGEFDLARQAFVSEHRAKADTPAVRLAFAWAILHQVLQKRAGFERPVAALGGVRAPDKHAADHAAALARSVKAVSPCAGCAGDGWNRCTNCHGQKNIYIICKACNGTRIRKTANGSEIFCFACKFTGIERKLRCDKCRDGYTDCKKCELPRCAACGSSGRSPCGTCKGMKMLQHPCTKCNGTGLGESTVCANCKGSGHEKVVKCPDCPNGFLDCAKCEPLRKPPALEDICASAVCGLCEGRGSVFRGVEWTCRACLGLGLKLTPKADPAKVLPD